MLLIDEVSIKPGVGILMALLMDRIIIDDSGYWQRKGRFEDGEYRLPVILLTACNVAVIQ